MWSDGAYYLEQSGPFQEVVGERKLMEVKTEDQFGWFSALLRSEAVGQVSTLSPHSSLFSRVGKGCDREKDVIQERLRGCPKVTGILEPLSSFHSLLCICTLSAGKP